MSNGGILLTSVDSTPEYIRTLDFFYSSEKAQFITTKMTLGNMPSFIPEDVQRDCTLHMFYSFQRHPD